MAIEFGSRKENFDNFKVYETTLAGRPFKVEMGKMCGLSNASALIRYGETCVMCNVVMSPKPREGYAYYLDFPTINLSCSGDTSETMVQRFDDDVLPFHPQ